MLQTLPATITDVLMLVLDVTEKTTAEITAMNRIAVIRQKMRVIVKKCVKPSVMAVKYLISHGSFVKQIVASKWSRTHFANIPGIQQNVLDLRHLIKLKKKFHRLFSIKTYRLFSIITYAQMISQQPKHLNLYIAVI